eukprot:TRINITY_DN4858_c0_g1_i11.p1 TRINITY_DN4858_c0_g1~~TRINITY_DN4858_c0_g1_i11.p1  ORF type:complete len:197 (-),score=33.83 TRINITY_DN4858_c0_g1_i11:877-1467(-)
MSSQDANDKKEDKSKLPEKIVLGDTYTMKHHLDMCVCETMKEKGYPEDYYLKNIKLILGVGSVVCAFAAQFGHYVGLVDKFPTKNSWFQNLGLVVGYLIFSGISALIEYFLIGEYELTFKSGDSKNKIRVATKLPKFSEMYTVTFQLVDAAGNSKHQEKIEKSVENYFHADGYLAPKKLKEDVATLLKGFVNKKSQ